MSKNLRVLLVAAEAAGAHVLRVIEGGGYTLAGLLIGAGERGERDPGPAVRNTASRLGCPMWPARSVRDPSFAQVIRDAGVDIMLNVHSLFVIRGEILTAPTIGSFNMHPGPLPEGAGLNAVSWALYEGKRQHAVTVHWMVPEIDAGGIAYSAVFPIEENDTALSLSARCVKVGVPLIERLLATAATDPAGIPKERQDLSQRHYRGREIPQGGRLDWSRSAREVVGFVRACDYLPFGSPWGSPQASVGGSEIAVVKAAATGLPSSAAPGTIGEASGRGVLVSAADEWVLVQRIVRDGRGADAADVLQTGHRFDGPVVLV